MSWQVLTKTDLLARLTAPETEALANAATDLAQDDPLDDIAHEVAEDWRGGLRRVTTIDLRTDAIPSEILIHILADFRYRAYTRLPGMTGFLDDRRVAEWQRAMTIRDNLAKVSYELPDAENIEDTESTTIPLPSVSVPHRHLLD